MPDMATMQQQMQQNPEMMRQMMDSPMMRSMTENPEMLRMMLESNPQLQVVEQSW
jgi:ubiquilin